MSEDSFSLSHRQLVSGLVSLVIGGDQGTEQLLGNLGYVLNALEVPMVDAEGHRFVPDLHLARQSLNLSLLIECKSGPSSVDLHQTACYLNMLGIEVVRQGRLTIDDPQNHKVDATFFVLGSAEPLVLSTLNSLTASEAMRSSGLGVVRIDQDRMSIQLDQLTDRELSTSLARGWNIRFADLPLERLPYEPSSPDWELAQAVLQTLSSFFLESRGSFDVEDVCRESNDLWPYLSDQHELLRRRVRIMVKNLRRTAFKGWLVKVAGTTETESRWRFADRPRDRANVQIAFQRRASTYIDLIRRRQQPRLADFVDVDQLPLPMILIADES